jgi:hypothetical protein
MPLEAKLYQPLPPGNGESLPVECVNRFSAMLMDALVRRARPHMPAAAWNDLVKDLDFAAITQLDREALKGQPCSYAEVPATIADPDCDDEPGERD